MGDWLGNRPFGILLMAGAAVYLGIRPVMAAEYFRDGWPTPSIIGVAVCAAIAIGLLLRQKWARWLGIGAMLGSFAFVYSDGFPPTWKPLVSIVAGACGIWWFWDMPITVEEVLRKGKSLDSDDSHVDD